MSSVPTRLSAPAGGRKMGELLAERIENEIVASGWKVGEVIGSEAELCERYGVSRAVFREAIRLVGHHGVAEMRRGPGGGLVVVEPSVDAAVRAVLLNLEYRKISPSQMTEARSAIEVACVRAAIKALTKAGEAAIREHMDNEVEMILAGWNPDEPSEDYPSNRFHLLLAELTGSPAMVMFVQILSRVTSRHSSPVGSAEDLKERAEQIHRVHMRIAEAILARDADAAERRLRRHVGAIEGYLND
ncbi:MAG: FCD domain-containing protein [Ilumatobacteraceae bacterium]